MSVSPCCLRPSPMTLLGPWDPQTELCKLTLKDECWATGCLLSHSVSTGAKSVPAPQTEGHPAESWPLSQWKNEREDLGDELRPSKHRESTEAFDRDSFCLWKPQSTLRRPGVQRIFGEGGSAIEHCRDSRD